MVLAEQLGDSLIIDLRVDGMAELLNAKVGTKQALCSAGRAVGLMPDATWGLAFGAEGQLLK